MANALRLLLSPVALPSHAAGPPDVAPNRSRDRLPVAVVSRNDISEPPLPMPVLPQRLAEVSLGSLPPPSLTPLGQINANWRPTFNTKKSPAILNTPLNRFVSAQGLKHALMVIFGDKGLRAFHSALRVHTSTKFREGNDTQEVAQRCLIAIARKPTDFISAVVDECMQDANLLDQLIDLLRQQRPQHYRLLSHLAFSGLNLDYAARSLPDEGLDIVINNLRRLCASPLTQGSVSMSSVFKMFHDSGHSFTDADRLAVMVKLHKEILYPTTTAEHYLAAVENVIELMYNDLLWRTQAYKSFFETPLDQLTPDEIDDITRRQLEYEEIFEQLSYAPVSTENHLAEQGGIDVIGLLKEYNITAEEHKMLVGEWNRRVASGMIDATFDEDTSLARGAAFENYVAV